MTPKIIVHGGAWEWDDGEDAAKHEGLHTAVSIGYQVLQSGGTAVDAVEQAVRFLEDAPIFDAGTGGYLNQAGVVQLDALIVDGATLEFGAVGGVTAVKNPITLARKVMEETDHCFFVGEGANLLAARLGIQQIENSTLITPQMLQFFEDQRTDGPSDTVGAVAMDGQGNVAAATSTSGTPYKPVGRVGDSPLYGSGGYAENGVGAVGATGDGENIMRLLLSKVVADQLAGGADGVTAVQAVMSYANKRFANSMCGVILVTAEGELAVAHTTPKIAIGWIDKEGAIQTAVHMSTFYDRI